jgi:hypothetical protein
MQRGHQQLEKNTDKKKEEEMGEFLRNEEEEMGVDQGGSSKVLLITSCIYHYFGIYMAVCRGSSYLLLCII